MTSKKKEYLMDDTKQCPYCAETIKSAAIVCRYCGRDIAPQAIQAQKMRAVGSSMSQIGCWLMVLGGILPFVIIIIASILTRSK